MMVQVDECSVMKDDKVKLQIKSRKATMKFKDDIMNQNEIKSTPQIMSKIKDLTASSNLDILAVSVKAQQNLVQTKNVISNKNNVLVNIVRIHLTNG